MAITMLSPAVIDFQPVGPPGVPGTPGDYDYAAIGAASAANIPALRQTLRTGGYAAAGDGGGALYKRVGSEPSHAGKFQSFDGGWWEYAENEINFLAFGGKPDSTTNNTTALVAAQAASVALGKPIVFPPGWYRFTTKPVLNGVIRWRGASGGAKFISSRNAPLLEWYTDAAIEDWYIRGIDFYCDVAAAATYSSSVGILFSGPASFLQHGFVEDVDFYGFYASWEVTKGTFETSFGNESTFAWNTFNGIKYRAYTNPSVYGGIMRFGSGTGNRFINVSGGPSGAYLYVQGNGAVVGDILFTGSHLGGGGATAVLRVGGGTVYLSRITETGNQFDAGCIYPVYFDDPSTTIRGNMIGSNSVGGAVDMATNAPFMAQSVVEDQEVSLKSSGKRYATNNQGAQTIPTHRLYIAPSSTVFVEYIAGGVVGGIGAGMRRAEYMIVRDTGTPVITTFNAQGAPSSGNAITGIVAAAGSDHAQFSFQMAPTAANSDIDAQIRVTGGATKLLRL